MQMLFLPKKINCLSCVIVEGTANIQKMHSSKKGCIFCLRWNNYFSSCILFICFSSLRIFFLRAFAFFSEMEIFAKTMLGAI